MSEEVFSSLVANCSVKMNIILDIEFLRQLYKFLFMLDIFRNLGVITSGNDQFNSIFAFLEIGMFIEKIGICLKSQIDVFLSFVAIEGKEIRRFKLIFNFFCFFISFKFFIKFGQINRRVKNSSLNVSFFEYFEVCVENILSILTVDVYFMRTQQRKFFNEVNKESI